MSRTENNGKESTSQKKKRKKKDSLKKLAINAKTTTKEATYHDSHKARTMALILPIFFNF